MVTITREGTERIMSHLKMRVEYAPIFEWSDAEKGRYIISAKAWIPDGGPHMVAASFGEVTASNNKNAYPVAMAEKRALSRAVLKLAGMYRLNVYGEDEIQNETK